MSWKFGIVVGISLFVFFGISLLIDSSNKKLSEATGLVVSIDSFPAYLETHPILESLPKNAEIEILIGDIIYEVKGHGVYEVDKVENKDLSISLPEGYESEIGELGLCSAIQKAIKNNEVVIETYSSKFNLFLKYSKLLKYKECLEG